MIPINDLLSGMDKYVSLMNNKISKDNKKTKEIGDRIINNLTEIYEEGKNKYLNSDQISFVGAMLYKLHQLSPINKKESDVETMYDTIFGIINNDPRFEGEIIQNLDLAPNIFENLLSIIESDVSEEVIGQERPPQGLINQITPTFSKKALPTETKQKIGKIAEILYPIVILSATMNPNAKIPTLAHEKRALSQDVDTFINEYNSQFGINEERNEMLLERDFFMTCLKKTWHYKRTNNL